MSATLTCCLRLWMMRGLKGNCWESDRTKTEWHDGKRKTIWYTSMLCLYSLPASYVAPWMLQHNCGYFILVEVKHSSELLNSRGIGDA